MKEVCIETFEDLAKMVAYEFFESMNDGSFETFEEMVECYWWSSKDIKVEVGAIITEATGYHGYIDEVDGTNVILNDTIISYRKFANMWRKALKSLVQ